jgi:predicted nuclease with TOPRIM domain
MDIITAIAAGTRALDAVRAVQDLNKSYDEATWKAKTAELLSDIADMKVALVEAQDRIRELQNQNEKLQAKLIFKVEKTKYEKGWRYEIFEDGTLADFPFCQRCETEGQFVRIVRSLGSFSSCPGCKANYETRSVMR